MRRTLRVLLAPATDPPLGSGLALLLFSLGCGSDPGPPLADGAMVDGSLPGDGFVAERDAFVPFDARVPADGGHDAGSPDGGVPSDGGFDVDSDVITEPLPIDREQAGGATVAAAMVGDLAFVGVGPRLTVWRLHPSAPPDRIGESAPLVGTVVSIGLAGDRAYALTYGGIGGDVTVLDVSDVTDPVAVHHWSLGDASRSLPVSLHVDSGRLTVADRARGIAVLDLSDPDRPAPTIDIPTDDLVAVQPVGERLYTASVRSGDRMMLAVRAASSLALVGETTIDDAEQVTFSRSGLAFVRGVGRGLRIVDMGDPGDPRVRLSLPDAVAYALVPSNDPGVVFAADDRGVVRRIDATDPTAVVVGGGAPETAWSVTGGAAAGGRLVLLNHQGQVRSFALSAGEASPIGDAFSGPCAWCYATAPYGHSIVAANVSPGAVSSVVVVDGQDLSFGGRFTTLGADFEEIDANGHRAFVADWFTGLWELDLTTPGGPTVVSHLLTGGYPSAVVATPTHVYLGESSGGGALRTFSRSASGPLPLGAIETSNVGGLAVQGRHAYVADRDLRTYGALRIYDVQNPADPFLVSEYLGCEIPRDVAVVGQVAVVGCGTDDSVHVVDVSDASNPVAMSVVPVVIPLPVGGRPVAYDGRFAYMGHSGGVAKLDLFDPGAPVLVETHPTGWIVRHLSLGPGRVVASTERGGLYQWPR